MKINLRMLVFGIVGLFVLPMFAQSVHATSVDFLCGPALCNGNINAVFSGGVLQSASDLGGITLVNDSGPLDDMGLNFSMIFDTTAAAPNISIFEPGGDNSQLFGTIFGFNGSQFGPFETVILEVLWTNLPADFANFLGAPIGVSFVTNIILTIDGSAQSIDVNIQPTPEPATLLLFGAGLLGLGGVVRRRLNV